jgi:hypothetical protein
LYFAKINGEFTVTHHQTGASMHSTAAIADSSDTASAFIADIPATIADAPGARSGSLFRVPAFARLALAAVMCAVVGVVAAPGAHAGVLTHTFSISGDNGETGSGTFVWNDDTVNSETPVSNSLSDIGDVLSLSIEISGGNVIGGSTRFTQADCVGAFLLDSPDFTTDINFFCNNGINTLAGISENTNFLNDTADFGAGLIPPVLGPASSTLTLSPGQTVPDQSNRAATVPVSPWWSLLGMALLIALFGRRAIEDSLKTA